MTTLASLNTAVASDLRDASYVTFSSATIDGFVNLGLAEVGRIVPQRFEEDITPRTGVLVYPLRCLLTPTGAESTDVFSCTSHGLDTATQVMFRSLTGGAGLAVDTRYYVIASGLTADAFKLSATLGGTAINFTTDVTASVLERLDHVPEIEVRRVEVWDNSTTPNEFVADLTSFAAGRWNTSSAGWDIWSGDLRISNGQYNALDLTKHYIKVWGYAPYRAMSATLDQNLSFEQQSAIREYARIEALRTLLANRQLFAQWQATSHASDVTPAALMNEISVAQDAWRRKARALLVLREVS